MAQYIEFDIHNVGVAASLLFVFPTCTSMDVAGVCVCVCVCVKLPVLVLVKKKIMVFFLSCIVLIEFACVNEPGAHQQMDEHKEWSPTSDKLEECQNERSS